MRFDPHVVTFWTRTWIAGWSAVHVVPLIILHDLPARRHPPLLPRADVRERLVEIFAAVRMADQERVQADRHHAAGLGAVLVEHVELVADHPPEAFRALMVLEHRRDVVHLR